MRIREATKDYTWAVGQELKRGYDRTLVAILFFTLTYAVVLLFGLMFYLTVIVLMLFLVIFFISPRTAEKIVRERILPRVRKQVREQLEEE